MSTFTPLATDGMEPLRVALFYDLNACRYPTGVTRHALAQLEQLSNSEAIDLQVVTGRVTVAEGRRYWEGLDPRRRHELPVRTRDILRYWRLLKHPRLQAWTGPVDWVYCPAEFSVSAAGARVAVTSHDLMQDLRFGDRRQLRMRARSFRRADLILSVSQFNTRLLLETFPDCRAKIAQVPNGAEDLFFEPPTEEERLAARRDLGLDPNHPYLITVANFQPRKNLPRLIRVAARLPEVARGDLALVILGFGGAEHTRALREAIAQVDPRARILMPGYRQGRELRALYAESLAMVFPSLCESFGIPVVEAMAQGIPVALADSTALPEVGGEAGWYFHPEDDDHMLMVLRDLLDRHEERRRRIQIGLKLAQHYRWDRAGRELIQALRWADGALANSNDHRSNNAEVPPT
ncbi:glycosyltransferase family 4 protein [Isosphaera pallida]|uniref:glycosyltransferase family 4 protein n=1 Tax=Isosphaera pallida TaxID=128 RepID=UPI001FCBCCB4|nr:glycosyltransferase family 1 protein [Isosphaera pallida]